MNLGGTAESARITTTKSQVKLEENAGPQSEKVVDDVNTTGTARAGRVSAAMSRGYLEQRAVLQCGLVVEDMNLDGALDVVECVAGEIRIHYCDSAFGVHSTEVIVTSGAPPENLR